MNVFDVCLEEGILELKAGERQHPFGMEIFHILGRNFRREGLDEQRELGKRIRFLKGAEKLRGAQVTEQARFGRMVQGHIRPLQVAVRIAMTVNQSRSTRTIPCSALSCFKGIPWSAKFGTTLVSSRRRMRDIDM